MVLWVGMGQSPAPRRLSSGVPIAIRGIQLKPIEDLLRDRPPPRPDGEVDSRCFDGRRNRVRTIDRGQGEFGNSVHGNRVSGRTYYFPETVSVRCSLIVRDCVPDCELGEP